MVIDDEVLCFVLVCNHFCLILKLRDRYFQPFTTVIWRWVVSGIVKGHSKSTYLPQLLWIFTVTGFSEHVQVEGNTGAYFSAWSQHCTLFICFSKKHFQISSHVNIMEKIALLTYYSFQIEAVFLVSDLFWDSHVFSRWSYLWNKYWWHIFWADCLIVVWFS